MGKILFSGLQPLIHTWGKHSPVMNPISFMLLLLGVPSLGSHAGERWHMDTGERHQRAKPSFLFFSLDRSGGQSSSTYHVADCVSSKHYGLHSGFFNHLPELHRHDGVRSLSCRAGPSAETRVPCARQWDSATWRAQAQNGNSGTTGDMRKVTETLAGRAGTSMPALC